MEKSPLQSKKFLAFLLSEVTWKIIIIVCVVKLIDDAEGGPLLLHWVMLTAVLIAGFIEAGFIGGQAWLDKYVRLAKITTEAATGAPSPDPDPEGAGSSDR